MPDPTVGSAKDALRVEIKGLKEAQKKMEQVLKDTKGTPVLQAFRQATLLVERDAKLNLVAWSPPGGPGHAGVNTGRLRASITPEVRVQSNVITGVVGSALKYACIFGSRTSVTTRSGDKAICQVQVGDEVLTQTGEYRRVTVISIRSALEKPELVDLTVAWRSDRQHHLTVTVDHKILVRRAGRQKWIEAGQITVADQVFITRKQAHNKGTGRKRKCLNCQKLYAAQMDGSGQGKTFCSNECKWAYWNSGHNPHVGMQRGAQGHDNMSKARKVFLALNPHLALNRILAKKGRITDIERQVRDWLNERGVAYQHQKQIGQHYADFFLPETMEIIEADGAYWHQDQTRDISRDMEMLAVMPDVKITHMHFYDRRFTPDMDPNPLPNVHYIVVNPDCRSFVDLDRFESASVLSVERWIYVRSAKPKASAQAYLYDLSVEGIHSFVASGIVVANCYQELGTGVFVGRPPHFPPPDALNVWAARHGGPKAGGGFAVAWAIFKRGGLRPLLFLQRALDKNKDKIPELINKAFQAITNK